MHVMQMLVQGLRPRTVRGTTLICSRRLRLLLISQEMLPRSYLLAPRWLDSGPQWAGTFFSLSLSSLVLTI